MMKSINQSIHAELDSLQYGQVDKFLLFRQLPVGLGGQIVGRIDSLRLALALRRKAVFSFHDDPPYHQTFEAMCTTQPLSIASEPLEPLNFAVEQCDQDIILFDPRLIGVRKNENEMWIIKKIEERIGFYDIDPLVLDGIILRWMKLRPDVKHFVDTCQKRLGVSENTLGVHLRRGDKSVETAFVPAAEINRRISAMHQRWSFDSIYLASDSPKAPREIELPCGVELIFDYEESRYNNANHKMLFANPGLAAQETLTAYKNIFLLSVCGGIVGQDNAHFAELAAAAITERRHSRETIVLIDGRIAEKHSLRMRLTFSAMRSIRKFLRSALPWLTLERRIRTIKSRD